MSENTLKNLAWNYYFRLDYHKRCIVILCYD